MDMNKKGSLLFLLLHTYIPSSTYYYVHTDMSMDIDNTTYHRQNHTMLASASFLGETPDAINSMRHVVSRINMASCRASAIHARQTWRISSAQDDLRI